MTRTRVITWVATASFIAGILLGSVPTALATLPSGDLTIIELKMTSSESIVLENTTLGTINLQNYLIQYFNSRAPVNLSVPTGVQALPNFNLGPQQSILLSGDSAATCGAAVVANLTMSLSDTSGYLQIVKVAQQSGSIVYTTQDHVNWTSGSTTPTDITQVPSSTADPNAVWYRKLTDGSWNKYEIDVAPCSLLANVSASASTTYVQWASGGAAPAVIISLASDDSGSAGIPTTDAGLAAPQISELLPNPAGTGTDDTDEFIELYNPNDSDFDLSGFVLETGLTTKHDYTFASGTTLPAKSFTAFYSADTGLTLSNTSGQAALLDPLGSVINQSDTYSSAKDGQSWSIANGQWYWTATPTPGAANIVKQTSSSSSKTSTKSSAGAVKSDSTTGGGSSSNFNNSTASPAPIHVWTLAAVGGLAVLYAGYEYRTDLANNLYRIRRYLEARRAASK